MQAGAAAAAAAATATASTRADLQQEVAARLEDAFGKLAAELGRQMRNAIREEFARVGAPKLPPPPLARVRASSSPQPSIDARDAPVPRPRVVEGPRLSTAFAEQSAAARSPASRAVPAPLGTPPQLGPRKAAWVSHEVAAAGATQPKAERGEGGLSVRGLRKVITSTPRSPRALVGCLRRLTKETQLSLPRLRLAEKSPPVKSSRIRSLLAAVVHAVAFELLTLAMIIINAVWVGLLVDRMSKKLDNVLPLWGYVIECTLCTAFALEMALRSFVHRGLLFSGRERQWHLFDMCVLVCHVCELVAWTTFRSQNYYSYNMIGFSHCMRIARLLRLVPLVNLPQFRDFRLMGSTISGSLKPFVCTLAFICWMVYMVAVYFTEYTLVYKLDTESSKDDVEAINQYFGTLLTSFYSLFQSITGGVNWADIANLSSRLISPRMQVVFLLYIAFSLLAVMNAVTSVFVESVHRTAQDAQDMYVLSRISDFFIACDVDKSKYITWSEFQELDQEKLKVYLKEMNMDRDEVYSLFYLLDENGEGISAEQLLRGCWKLNSNAKALDVMLVSKGIQRLEAEVEKARRELASLHRQTVLKSKEPGVHLS